jgi:hypothetical protein
VGPIVCKVALRQRRNSPSAAVTKAALPPSTPAISAPVREEFESSISKPGFHGTFLVFPQEIVE